MAKGRPWSQRNQKQETAYENSPKQVKKREARNKARYQLEKQGKVHKGDGKDVDHKKMLESGGSNKPSNWRVVSAHQNRSRQPKHKGKGK